jgi:cystathionine beta-lyase
MGKYNFDEIIDRHNTGSLKYDALQDFFGRTDLTPLWVADMDFAVSPEIQQALLDRMRHPIYGYGNPSPEYWQSIINWLSRRHGWKVTREELAYIPGVVKGIGFAINFFTRPGDKVVIQPPVYHPFRLTTEGNGRTVVNNPLIRCGDSYAMNLDGLEQIFATEHPKMMILCNPHNPIGLQWDEDTLRRVASLAYRYGVVVVSDEIHGDLMLNGRKHVPFASVSDEAAKVAVTLGAPSKTFNIAGLVSSWVIVKNEELRKPFFAWLEANEFDAPTFVATIATEAAYNHGEEWLDECLAYIEGTIEEAARIVADTLPGVKFIRPEASFLAWLDCHDLGLSHDELIDLFINKAHLALNDGAMFGAEGDGFMRLNLGAPRSLIYSALAGLADAIASLKK